MRALELHNAGFTRLVSVAPPGSTISPNSKLDPASLGKAPARRGFQGWAGYDWRREDIPAAQIDAWGANVGLQAREYPAIDIDCTDPGLVRVVEGSALLSLGDAPARVGSPPKRLLVYRTKVPFGRMRLWINENTPEQALVEILGDGQQYLVAGTHPSGREYTWDGPGLTSPDRLSEITAEEASAWLDALQRDLEDIGFTCRREGTGRTAVDRSLIGQDEHMAPSAEAVAEVVASIPNNGDFAGRDDYLRMGYAIKAAAGDEAGLPIFHDWCARWEDGANDPDVVEADWARMAPPFEVGWGYLLDMGQRYGFKAAGIEFEAEEAPQVQPGAANAEADFEAEEPSAGAPEPQEGPAGTRFVSAAVLSDTDLALRFFNRAGRRFCFCDGLGGWQTWEHNRWRLDEARKVETAMQRFCNTMAAEAHSHLDGKEANKAVHRLTSSSIVDAVLVSLRRLDGVTRHNEEFDADPMLLNTPAGAVDLRTGRLVPGKHPVTKSTSVAPAPGPCPTWMKFLTDSCSGDPELVAYLRRSFGYWLTGRTTEQQFLFIWGPGGNGKSVFQQAVMGILGDYAVSAGSEVFTASTQDRHKEEIARLRGARFVGSSETQEGRYLDEAKIKLLTGGDRLEARFMQKNTFQFQPQFKIVMLGNHKPGLRNPDKALLRRLHLVNWTHVPAKPDPELAEKLRAEYPQILAWAIEGCLEWQEEGLNPPPAVRDATKEYIEDEDPMQAFLEERCVRNPSATVLSTDVFEAWTEWAHAHNEFVGTQKRLTAALRDRFGFERWKHPHTGMRGLRGLELIYKPGEFEADKGTQPAPVVKA